MYVRYWPFFARHLRVPAPIVYGWRCYGKLLRPLPAHFVSAPHCDVLSGPVLFPLSVLTVLMSICNTIRTILPKTDGSRGTHNVVVDTYTHIEVLWGDVGITNKVRFQKVLHFSNVFIACTTT